MTRGKEKQTAQTSPSPSLAISKQSKNTIQLSKSDIDSIANSVSEILQANFDSLKESIENCVAKADFERTKTNVRIGCFQNDKLEQYTRRENIRIHNFRPDLTIATLDEHVVQLLNHMVRLDSQNPHDETTVKKTVGDGNLQPESVDAQEEEEDAGWVEEGSSKAVTKLQGPFSVSDISVCHNVKSKGGKPQIMVRFVSRRSVMECFKNKKKLKNSPIYKDIFISDDLTPLRMRMKDLVRNVPNILRVHTRDGNIHCDLGGKHHVISSPDDLFNIGIEMDLASIGLGHLN